MRESKKEKTIRNGGTEEEGKRRKEVKGIGGLWILFFSFFKVGLFTIGGGMAMIPLIEKVVVRDRGWLCEDEMLDCLAVSQSLPGVVAINIATYIGKKKRGIPGSLAATLGVILPSFIIILILAAALNQIGENPRIQGALIGIKAGVTGLLITVTYKMVRRSIKSVFSWVILVGSFAAVGIFGVTAVWAILAAAVAGIIYFQIKARRKAS